MTETEQTVKLRPGRGSKETRVGPRGAMATVARPKEKRRRLRFWAWWSGPVGAALCVDGTSPGSCWLETRSVVAPVCGHHPAWARLQVSAATPAVGAPGDR
jgi:hypothetical protein